MITKLSMTEDKKLRLRNMFLQFFDAPNGYKITEFRKNMDLNDYTNDEISNMSIALQQVGLIKNVGTMKTNGAAYSTTEAGRKVLDLS